MSSLPITQRRVSAADTGIHKPAMAASSVFDAARQAKPVRAPLPDPAKVQVKRGVPIPPNVRGAGAARPYDAILDRMGVGDCVELPKRQAHSMVARAKALGIKTAMRTIGPDTCGVWRLGEGAAA